MHMYTYKSILYNFFLFLTSDYAQLIKYNKEDKKKLHLNQKQYHIPSK